MKNLQKVLNEFVMSKESRENVLKGSAVAPVEFEQIAKITLSGHFLVKGHQQDIVVRPICIEFYYHEERDGGIKDYIVYHRNSKSTRYMPFPLGILHGHQSGIDITFEKGDTPENAIRASMLIRKFEINGRMNDRPTCLYEALYQQSSVFDGISVEWVDGEKPVEVISKPRKNVTKFDESGQKFKEFVQDPRCWQFERKAVCDADTDKVYISALLKNECPDFYSRFIDLLNENHIPFGIMEKTADIWARDYMPIQIYDDLFVQYCFNPDYLQEDKYKPFITDTNAVCEEIGIDTVKTKLVIDGGNVVKAGRYVIMTEKVYKENPSLKPAEIRRELKDLFHADIIMLPWDKKEFYGHADGVVKPIDDETVLLTNYADYDPKLAGRFEKILSQYFKVRTLHYDTKSSESNWAYSNFLRVGNIIILPGLGIPEDTQALQQVQSYYPACNVLQIECSEVVAKDGALNCITWNIKS